MVRQGAGVKEQQHGERASKGASLQMKISPGDLTHSIVTMVNVTVLYIWKLLEE